LFTFQQQTKIACRECRDKINQKVR